MAASGIEERLTEGQSGSLRFSGQRMKKCPTCNRTYSDDTLRFCLEDGSSLSAAYDPQTTQRMPARHGGDSQSTEILLHPEKAAETVESRAYPTTPSPPSPAFV